MKPKLDPPASYVLSSVGAIRFAWGEPRRMTGRRSLDRTNKEILPKPKFSQGCSIRSVTADRDPSRLGQLECNRGCGDSRTTRANRTTPWMEWPLRRGIRTRYIRVCINQAELLDENRQRYLAKECVGSNRGRQERSQLPAATTTELNPIRSVHRQNENAPEHTKRR